MIDSPTQGRHINIVLHKLLHNATLAVNELNFYQTFHFFKKSGTGKSVRVIKSASIVILLKNNLICFLGGVWDLFSEEAPKFIIGIFYLSIFSTF